jgi:hypothetical protein
VRRGKMSCWGGEQWILAQEKEAEWKGWEEEWEDDGGKVDSIERKKDSRIEIKIENPQ